jgi:hypothetical protein
MRFAAAEKEFPLPSPLRGYILVSRSSADSGALSIFPTGSNSEPYTVSIEPMIDTRHPKSITMYSPSFHNTIIGAVRMEDGSDTIDLALGDPENSYEDESCAWEHMHIRRNDLHIIAHEFALGLGDDMRRNFEWCAVETDKNLTWSSVIPNISKYLHEERVGDAQRRCFKLIDRNAGETVAMVMRHKVLLNGEIINSDDIGDLGTRGRFVIFRDFWESGRYEDNWDRMILLSGLAVLESTERE